VLLLSPLGPKTWGTMQTSFVLSVPLSGQMTCAEELQTEKKSKPRAPSNIRLNIVDFSPSRSI
jgi:hypothetical protein